MKTQKQVERAANKVRKEIKELQKNFYQYTNAGLQASKLESQLMILNWVLK